MLQFELLKPTSIVNNWVTFPQIDFASAYMEAAYCESHRYFHNLVHLNNILDAIERDITAVKSTLTVNDYNLLVLAAYFHDVIYDPLRFDNESRCADLVENFCTHPDKLRVAQIVRDTKNHTVHDELSAIFNAYDTAILRSPNYHELLEYEEQIMREYQAYDYSLYAVNRSTFLEEAAKDYENPLLLELAKYVKSRTLKVGLYLGTFNPFTIGHYSTLHKSELIFDKVIICSGINPDKVDLAELTQDQIRVLLETRLQNIKETLPYHQVHVFAHSIPKLLKEFSDYQLTVIKGIRGSKDLEEENLQRAYIEDVVEDYSIIYIPADRLVEHVSSSGLKFLRREGLQDEFARDWAKKYECNVFLPHPIQQLLTP